VFRDVSVCFLFTFLLFAHFYLLTRVGDCGNVYPYTVTDDRVDTEEICFLVYHTHDQLQTLIICSQQHTLQHTIGVYIVADDDAFSAELHDFPLK
jgi:hypothetical protein